VFVAITINFFLFRVLPGDAVRNLSRVPRATEELMHSLEVQFGLDKPIWQQYLIYLRELFHGNMGISFSNQQPVWDNLREALMNTIPMAALGTSHIVIGSSNLRRRRRTRLDQVSTNLAIAFYSFPTQWLALVLLIYLSSWFPSHGMTDPFLIDPTWQEHVVDVLRHMALPSLTFALTLYGETP
jgi:ABC-type dipeptide/oligopeptide/nickel transport system permease component